MIKNLRNNLKKKKKGFTLIELIIVIAIIGILAVIAVPKFGSVQKDAKIKADIATAKQISNVTQLLLTQEKITLPATTAKVDVKHIKVGAGDGEGELIIENLQSTPKPEFNTSSNTAFYVCIDEDGGVTVSVGDGAKSATIAFDDVDDIAVTGTRVYPNGASPYSK